MKKNNPNKEIIGTKFDKVVVKKFSHINQYRTRVYECECECGNIIHKTALALKQTNFVCCKACRIKLDSKSLVGIEFNGIKVLETSEIRKDNHRTYKCMCPQCKQLFLCTSRDIKKKLKEVVDVKKTASYDLI